MNEIVVMGSAATVLELAACAENVVLADCNVAAPELRDLTGAKPIPHRTIWGSGRAMIHESRCSGCGECRDHCRFNAIVGEDRQYTVDPFGCNGCGACLPTCPTGAIALARHPLGALYRSTCSLGLIVQGRLEGNPDDAGDLAAAVRVEARTQPGDWLFVNAPVGTAGPTIAAIVGATLLVTVNVPPSVHELIDHFRVPHLRANQPDLWPQILNNLQAAPRL